MFACGGAAIRGGEAMLVTSGLLAVIAQDDERPCTSLVQFSSCPDDGRAQDRPHMQQLPAPARTYCVHLDACGEHLLAAGGGPALRQLSHFHLHMLPPSISSHGM